MNELQLCGRQKCCNFWKKSGGCIFPQHDKWRCSSHWGRESAHTKQETNKAGGWQPRVLTPKLIVSLDHCCPVTPHLYKVSGVTTENLQLLIVQQEIKINNLGNFNEDIFHLPRSLYPFYEYSQVWNLFFNFDVVPKILTQCFLIWELIQFGFKEIGKLL